MYEGPYTPHHSTSHPQPSRRRQCSLCGSPLTNGNCATRTQNHCIGDSLLLSGPYYFDGADVLQQSLHSLFALLVTGDTSRYCLLSHRNRHESVHCCSHRCSYHVGSTVVGSCPPNRALDGGHCRCLWSGENTVPRLPPCVLAMTSNLKIGVVHKENPAGRAITKLLASLCLDNEHARLFVRAVGREEAAANTASIQYDRRKKHTSHSQEYSTQCSAWHIGTGSIRKHEAKTTGLRFVQWMHHDNREAAQADPPPEASSAVTGESRHGSPRRTRNETTSSFSQQGRKVPKAFEASASSPVGAQM